MVALTRQRVQEILSVVERLDKKIQESNQVQDAKMDSLMARWQGNQVAPSKTMVANIQPARELSPEPPSPSTGANTLIRACSNKPREMRNPRSKETEVVHCAEKQVSTLVRLRAEMEELACAEVGVVHEVEKQISTLLSHVQIAASLIDALPEQDSMQEAGIVSKQSLVSPENINMISLALEEMHHSTHPQLLEETRALNAKIRAVGMVLDKQEGLFHNIKKLAPQDLFKTGDTNTCVVHHI